MCAGAGDKESLVVEVATAAKEADQAFAGLLGDGNRTPTAAVYKSTKCDPSDSPCCSYHKNSVD